MVTIIAITETSGSVHRIIAGGAECKEAMYHPFCTSVIIMCIAATLVTTAGHALLVRIDVMMFVGFIS
ncbi:hypothetical protein DKW60_10810 [Leucothrix pacifica]|uniref:Uncharacterized protein n=1 Tax=Leucothrix pacifica TaxID=1247513 RepID=A0A317CIH0_9GAMM|nr:hypothetical protein DKW60_10810 [Leucothrix pacifica]